MNAVIAWFQQAIADLNKVAVAVGNSIHEIVGSKRALLGALAVALPTAAQVFPQYADSISKVLPFAETVFLILGVLDTIRPLGVPVAPAAPPSTPAQG